MPTFSIVITSLYYMLIDLYDIMMVELYPGMFIYQ